MRKLRIRQRDVVACPMHGHIMPILRRLGEDGPNEVYCSRCEHFKSKSCYYVTCLYEPQPQPPLP